MCHKCEELKAKIQNEQIKANLSNKPKVDGQDSQKSEELVHLGTVVLGSSKISDGVKGMISRALGESNAKANATSEGKPKTLVIENSHKVSIAPFASLEDVVVAGEKFGSLLFPERELDSRDYEIAVIAAATKLATVAEEDKLQALTELLGLTLIGFEKDQLPEAKAFLKDHFEDAVHDSVKQLNTEMLQSFGLVPA